jgi:hypothetical protein
MKLISICTRQILPSNIEGIYELFINGKDEAICVKFPDLHKYALNVDGELSSVHRVNIIVTCSPFNLYECFIDAESVEKLKSDKIYDLYGIFVYKSKLKGDLIHRIDIVR